MHWLRKKGRRKRVLLAAMLSVAVILINVICQVPYLLLQIGVGMMVWILISIPVGMLFGHLIILEKDWPKPPSA